MLTITLIKKSTKTDGSTHLETLSPITWKTKDPAPKIPDLLHADQVLVEADTNELWWIERRFVGIPFIANVRTDGKLIWTGDWARFIIMNLTDS